MKKDFIYKKTTKKPTHEQFMGKVKSRTTFFEDGCEFTSEYIGSNKPINCHCNICGHDWVTPALSVLGGTGCPKCADKRSGERSKEKGRINTLQRMKEFAPNLEMIDEYKGSGVPIRFKCKDCGSILTIRPQKINKKFQCSICNDGISFPNKLIRNFLHMVKAENFKYEYCPEWLKPRRMDAYFTITKNNVKQEFCVEMDGSQHYSKEMNFLNRKIKDVQELDALKQKLCEEHGIEVIRIDSGSYKHEDIVENLKNSKLKDLFDLKNFDWVKCTTRSEKSILKELRQEITDSISNNAPIYAKEIMEKYSISETCMYNYILTMKKYGWIPKSFGLTNTVYRAVNVYGPDYKFQNRFNRINECIRFYDKNFGIKFGDSCISTVMNHKQEKHKGYYFVSDEDKEEFERQHLQN